MIDDEAISSNQFQYDPRFSIYSSLAGVLGSAFDERNGRITIRLEHSQCLVRFVLAEVLTDRWGVVGWMYFQEDIKEPAGYAVVIWNR